MKHIVDVVEEGKVGVNLEHPIWLGGDERADEEEGPFASEKRLDLHPSDDVVERPADVQEDGCDREIPAVDWRMREDLMARQWRIGRQSCGGDVQRCRGACP